MKSEDITNVTIANINMRSTFCGYPSSSCFDILHKTTDVNLMVVLVEKSGLDWYDSSPGERECLYKISRQSI